MSQDNSAMRKQHWEKTRTLTLWVLVVWFIFSIAVHWFAESLNSMTFLGFPLGYYFAVQGSLAIFVLLVFIQNKVQDKIDDNSGLGQD